MSEAEKIAFLRARGVEIDIPGERVLPVAPPPGAPEFEFVSMPADVNVAVSTERTAAVAAGDGLKQLLAPRFADDAAMDEEVVARETAARIKTMLSSGNDAMTVVQDAATASAMQRAAAGGACEA